MTSEKKCVCVFMFFTDVLAFFSGSLGTQYSAWHTGVGKWHLVQQGDVHCAAKSCILMIWLNKSHEPQMKPNLEKQTIKS